MQDRGPASYLAEFIGTLMLVLFICLVVSIFVQLPSQALPAPFIDWSVIGLAHVFILFVLIQTLAVVSGAHFNPAVTVAMATLRQIKPADAVIYIVAQLAGAVAAALIVKLLLNHFPNAELVNYGAVGISPRLDGKLVLGDAGRVHRHLRAVFAIMGAAVDPRTDRALGPLAIGAALGVARHGHGAAHRRRPQPGPRLRAGARVRRAGAASGTSCASIRWRPILGAVAAALVYFNLFITPGREGPGGTGAGRLRAGAAAGRRLGRDAPGHLLAQLHAVAVAHVPVLLQVLRVRHAPGASARARRGRAAARRRLAARGEGAARAHRREAGGQPRGGGPAGGVRARRLRVLRGLGVRAGARARDAAAHERGGLHARGARAPASGHRLAGPDARVGEPRPGRAPGLAHEAPRAPPRDDPARGRAAHPLHQRHPRGHRRGAGRARAGARGAGRAARASTATSRR